MRKICIALIDFYQRFVSPYKGFKCAHHTLHQSGSCSHAVKNLIDQKGLWKAWPAIKSRFRECSNAYQVLTDKTSNYERADFPCDFPCDLDIGSCGADSTSTVFDCYWPCDLLSGFSKRTQRRIIVGVLMIALFGAYWFYGRGVGSIVVEDISAKQSIFKKLIQRQQPKIRLLLTHQGKKYYSDIVTIENKNQEYRFRFASSPNDFKLDNLKILDARVNVGNELVVLGQVLEEFERPKKIHQGERFSYRIKRRWHFF